MSSTLPQKPIRLLPDYPAEAVDPLARAPFDAGPVTYGATLEQLAAGALDKAFSFKGVGAFAEPRPAGERLRDSVSIFDYGVVGDGVADDTAAWRAALATGRSITIGKPANFKITGALTIQAAGQRIEGCGRYGAVFTPVGSFDLFDIRSPTSATLRGAGLARIRIVAGGMTGGNCFAIRNHSKVIITDVQADQPWNFAYVERVNAVYFQTCEIGGLRGEYGYKWFGNAALKSDLLTLTDCIISAPSGSTAEGIDWDGNCATLRLQNVGMIDCRRGIYAHSSTGEGKPGLLFADDLEIDGSLDEGIRIETGDFFYIDNLYQHASVREHGIFIGDAVRKCRIAGTAHGNFKSGLYCAGRDTFFAGHIYGNSNQRSALWSGVTVAGVATRFSFAGLSGTPGEGGTVKQRFGVEIQPGARWIDINAYLGGNVLGPWIDYSGGGRSNINVRSTNGNTSIIQGLAISTARGFGASIIAQVAGGAVTGGEIYNAGRGYDTEPTVGIVGDGTGAAATAQIANGVITGITITNGGSGYTWAEIAITGGLSDPTIRSHAASSGSLGLAMRACGAGTLSLGNDVAQGMQVTSDIISALLPVRLPAYTKAELPSPSAYARCLLYVSDGAGTRRLAISNGAQWLFPDGNPVS